MPIRTLPPNVISQIAAGEVVERPASAVKELLENALDAHATEITVETRDGGRSFIRLSDNGAGIPAAEVELAFDRHATSKLASADDLTHISTLGFRGEALASIASVAKVTCVTRSREDPIGTRIVIDGGTTIDRGPIGAPAGTVITVENLFYTVPARLKFLKSDTTERRQIDQLISRYALAYPAVRFTLIHAGRTSFQTTGNGSLKDVLVAVYGLDAAGQMLALSPAPPPTSPEGAGEGERDRVRVQGFISAPALSRANRSDMTLFVNGRWVQDRSLNTAVLQAYHTLLMVGRYPLCIIQVEMKAEDVDVNVHPAKTEVRFRNSDVIFRAVQRAVRRTLIDRAPIPQVEAPLAGSPPATAWQATFDAHDATAASRLDQLRSLRPVEHSSAQWLEWGAVHDDPPSGAETLAAADLPPGVRAPAPVAGETDGPSMGVPSMGVPPTLAPQPVARPGEIPPLRVIGQIGATYIIAEGPEGLYLIDQHAAHERVLYEKFMADQAARQVAVQNLLDPLPIEFSPDESTLIEEHVAVLRSIGLDFEPFGGSTWLVRSVPALLAHDDLRAAMVELVADLMAGDLPFAANEEAKLITRVCKRAAIKGGQVLAYQEMSELIRQLEVCVAPRTCPHGRPTMIHFSAAQMAKEFGRI